SRIYVNERLQLCAGFDIPEFQHAVVACGGKHLTVRTVRDGLDCASEGIQFLKLSACGNVPNSRCAVSARRGHESLVRAEDCQVDTVRVPGNSPSHLSRAHVDKSDHAVCPRHNECFAVTTES